jgi:hypothetical protein
MPRKVNLNEVTLNDLMRQARDGNLSEFRLAPTGDRCLIYFRVGNRGQLQSIGVASGPATASTVFCIMGLVRKRQRMTQEDPAVRRRPLRPHW